MAAAAANRGTRDRPTLGMTRIHGSVGNTSASRDSRGATTREIAEISAAICTRDRPEQLRRALQSLVSQQIAPREILVVDNAPTTDATRQLVAREFPHVRYLHEPVPGLDFARNRALALAATDIVAFLDDDAVADVNWVGATIAAFTARPRLGACTGMVNALGSGTEGERLFEANGGFARGTEQILLPAAAGGRLSGRSAPLIAWSISVGSGCSMAVRRQMVLDLGGFDEALDLGAALPGGGDLDIFWRILDAGFEVLYEPSVSARHEHRPERSAAIGQITGHNRALVAWLTKSAARARGRRRFSVLVFLGWRLIKPGFRIARRAVGRDPLPLPALLQLWGSGWAGLWSYPRAKKLARQRRQEYQ
ncbi:hypothetical protein BH23GEM3_BH23GEM3_08110 [soil metagenome]